MIPLIWYSWNLNYRNGEQISGWQESESGEEEKSCGIKSTVEEIFMMEPFCILTMMVVTQIYTSQNQIELNICTYTQMIAHKTTETNLHMWQNQVELNIYTYTQTIAHKTTEIWVSSMDFLNVNFLVAL